MEPIKLTLDFERSTKRYHVYRDSTGTLVPDRLYVLQQENRQAPETVTVTIEA